MSLMGLVCLILMNLFFVPGGILSFLLITSSVLNFFIIAVLYDMSTALSVM